MPGRWRRWCFQGAGDSRVQRRGYHPRLWRFKCESTEPNRRRHFDYNHVGYVCQTRVAAGIIGGFGGLFKIRRKIGGLAVVSKSAGKYEVWRSFQNPPENTRFGGHSKIRWQIRGSAVISKSAGKYKVWRSFQNPRAANFFSEGLGRTTFHKKPRVSEKNRNFL